MQLETTCRGLSEKETNAAMYALGKGQHRFERLVDETCAVKAVIDGGPENKVTLSLSLKGQDYTATSTNRDLHPAIYDACDKIKRQLAKHAHRKSNELHSSIRTGAVL